MRLCLEKYEERRFAGEMIVCVFTSVVFSCINCATGLATQARGQARGAVTFDKAV
jgi:hypothetical protein